MGAVKRVLTIAAFTAPLVIGCAGLASAQGVDASYGQGYFTANQNGAGFGINESSVGPDGVSHVKAWTWADDNGVSGGYTASGATIVTE
ncbi:hypothetical protein ACIQI7_19975 [Kitasatospora sp. NPDC092039]|uniref:hypothetical protein n=1 Tax=Kitasatospora sp. NPDC092039 TaxID=3364086 RepID=UPI003822393F